MKKIIIPGLIIIFAAFMGAGYLVIKSAPHKLFPAKIKSSALEKPRPSAQTAEAQAAKRVPRPPQSSADQEKVIKEIRHELQAVMNLNQKINSVQQSKSAQLLRIQEQAQIHQRILSEIQKTPGDKQIQIPSRQTLLAQEKLRIIREETLRNKKILEETPVKPAA